MAVQLGQTAPDFEQDSTEGPISFHKWLGNSWGYYSATPGTTPGLHHRARGSRASQPDRDKRKVKPIGLSVDPLDSHAG